MLLVALLLPACGGGGEQRPDTGTASGVSATATTNGSDPTTGGTGSGTGTSTAASSTGAGSSSTGLGCTFCDGPNEKCVDDECVTTCQGIAPDPCPAGEACDVISGECVAPGSPCTLTGSYEPCGQGACGPGSVCDGAGQCIPIAPCAEVACLDDGTCWGTACSCQRVHGCTTLPDEGLLNGPFSDDIFDLEFADDCTAWMVTLRSGTDYVRRLAPDGTLTEWPGVANLNMGEVAVLRALTPPVGISLDPTGRVTSRPAPRGGGLGEVAITYTCCATCGCQADPPQGMARLDEANPNDPLVLLIPAVVTQGSGPFGSAPADAGPMGLTWGEDRVLYVGNSTANGNLDTADLDAMTQSALAPLPDRITAAAPISGAHLLVATLGGKLYRYNVLTQTPVEVAQLPADVTSLAFDSFSGRVYASLSDLDVLELDPWTGASSTFETMPAIGRVAVAPHGRLFYVPARYLVGPGVPISSWDLPDTF